MEDRFDNWVVSTLYKEGELDVMRIAFEAGAREGRAACALQLDKLALELDARLDASDVADLYGPELRFTSGYLRRAAEAIRARGDEPPSITSSIPTSSLSREERRDARERISPSPRVEDEEEQS